MRKFPIAIAAALLPFASAQATLIDFEDFGNVGISGPSVTNQYAGVLFSSTGGQTNQVSSQPGIGFGTNFICTGTGAINCTGETLLDFSAPVSGLSFWAVGSDNAGDTARVDVFTNNVFAGTQVITTNGVFHTPNFVDLTSFSDVTRIRIYGITDGGGLGWDNFEFTPAVPEPATAALWLLGLAAVGGAAARRRRGA